MDDQPQGESMLTGTRRQESPRPLAGRAKRLTGESAGPGTNSETSFVVVLNEAPRVASPTRGVASGQVVQPAAPSPGLGRHCYGRLATQ